LGGLQKFMEVGLSGTGYVRVHAQVGSAQAYMFLLLFRLFRYVCI